MELQRQLRQAYCRATALGCFNALLYVINGIVTRVAGKAGLIERYSIVAQPVPEHSILLPRFGSTIDVREIDHDEPQISQLRYPRTHAYRLDQGAVALGAFKSERLIGAIWLCFGPYEELDVRSRWVPLPKGTTVLDIDIYVVPEERHGFAFARLWDGANTYLRSHGIMWSLSLISVFNLMSLASHRRLGARQIGSVTYLKLGTWQLMFSTGSPYIHLSLTRAQVPSIRLYAPEPSSYQQINHLNQVGAQEDIAIRARLG